MPRYVRWPSLLLIACLGACVAKTTAVSNKASSYIGEPKRLFVFETLQESVNMSATDVDQQLIAALTACGTVAESRITPAAPNSLSLTVDDAEAENRRQAADQIRRFRPDSALTVVEARWTAQRNAGGLLASATYSLSLYDIASKKTVWKARIDLKPGIRGSDPAGALARAVVERLSQDGILRSCPPPKSDKPHV